MRRKLIVSFVLGTSALLAFVGWQPHTMTAQQAANGAKPIGPPTAPLPITKVIFFSSGVGYFERDGEVEGNARVDLSFPATDVNDLLKSLVLHDLGGGKISAISYDSRDPVEKALKRFALDLTYNPSFGELLNQARGEKIEVVLQSNNTTQPATLTGIIVGMEARKAKEREVELLNLLCTEGMRNIPLDHIQRVRLLNPVLDSEFRRALEVLADAHDTQKKTVSLAFNGAGKRNVRVGYVVENPIWKTSYRLVLGKDNKAQLQGWALVENTQDEDWNNARMVLISGRPISFQMDLYEPLYLPRPTVEPELFASLRPPAYNGAMNNDASPAVGAAPAGAGNPGNAAGLTGMPAGPSFGNRYQMGINPFGNGGPFGNDQRKLTFEELQQRRQELQAAKDAARKVGSGLAAPDPLNMEPVEPRAGVASVASAEEIGDYFQYTIDQRISLRRQKSAMLPIIDQSVTGTKVSIFNEAVHPKFPLLGLRLKNTTSNHLMQGPITVYEGGSYAGDSRVMDLQPNEERLISYAIDQGVELKTERASAPDQLVAIKLVKGVLRAANKVRQTEAYLIKNRSEHERTLIIEHPIRADWNLVTPEKPGERSRDMYRFQVTVPAGKTVTHTVVEEQTRRDRIELTAADDRTLTFFLTNNVSSPALKDAVKKTLGQHMQVADTRRELAQLEHKLKTITDDQARLRANLEKVPPTSAAYKRYLDKFDTQETEIEKLQEQIVKQQEALEQRQKEYEELLKNLTAD